MIPEDASEVESLGRKPFRRTPGRAIPVTEVWAAPGKLRRSIRAEEPISQHNTLVVIDADKIE